MSLSINEAELIRDYSHNLELSNSEHQKIYDDTFFHIVITCEDKKLVRYRDHKKKTTIGYGFNMDDGETSRKFWKGAFGDSIDFDEVYNGQMGLTEEEAMKLYKYGRDVKRAELEKLFGTNWEKLKANEKLMIEDLFFNGGYSMIGKHTNFYKNIKLYIASSDPHYLNEALIEIRDRSNDARGTENERGVQNRRNAQYTLGNSLECLWYRKPNQHPMPDDKDKKQIIIGKTVIPQKHGSENCYYSEKLYIWRTKGDSKVRARHNANEGKIFSVDNPPPTGNPGTDYNCRCTADHFIPSYVEFPNHKNLNGKLLHKASLEYFIRYGNNGEGGGIFIIT